MTGPPPTSPSAGRYIVMAIVGMILLALLVVLWNFWTTYEPQPREGPVPSYRGEVTMPADPRFA